MDRDLIRKAISITSLVLSVCGLGLVVIFALVGIGMADNLEQTAGTSAQAACNSVNSMSDGISNLAIGLDSVESALKNGSASLSGLANSTTGLASVVAIVDATSANNIRASGAAMENASSNFATAAVSAEDLKGNVSSLRDSIDQQKSVVCGNKIVSMVGNIKLLIILFAIFMACVLFVVSLNSLTGFI